MIRLKNLHKTYYMGRNQLHVLKGIDLHVQEGELVSVMGSSGSGKSTLLNVIGLLDTYDSGEYRLNNEPIQQMSETRAAQVRNRFFGFEPQPLVNLLKYAVPTYDMYCLRISTGCLGNCAYCAVKLAKGRLVSRPMESLLEEAGPRARELRRNLDTPDGRDSLAQVILRRKVLSRLVEIAKGEESSSAVPVLQGPAEESSPGGTQDAGTP